MQPVAPPEIAGVEVVAAQPTETDHIVMAHRSAQLNQPPGDVAYVVKIKLKSKPPVSSTGWALYVGDLLIPKYWEYDGGIYFTVVDPQFFAEHRGKRLRFSQNGVDFHNTGKALTAAPAVTTSAGARTARSSTKAAKSRRRPAGLPTQAEVLK
jgi:hypothetical protein